jgi:hypothetical protein
MTTEIKIVNKFQKMMTRRFFALLKGSSTSCLSPEKGLAQK